MERRVYHFFIMFLWGSFAISSFSWSHSNSLEAKFIGNEAFLITDGGITLATDFPYTSGAYGYMEYDFDFDFDQAGKNTISLITHRHKDHFDPSIFINLEWNIIGPDEIVSLLPQNKVIELSNEITLGPVKIIPKKTKHANTQHYSYTVEWHNKILFFTGDTQDPIVYKGLPELDVLFITPSLYRKSKQENMLPIAKKIIIYHHLADDIVPDCGGCIIPVQNDLITID